MVYNGIIIAPFVYPELEHFCVLTVYWYIYIIEILGLSSLYSLNLLDLCIFNISLQFYITRFFYRSSRSSGVLYVGPYQGWHTLKLRVSLARLLDALGSVAFHFCREAFVEIFPQFLTNGP